MGMHISREILLKKDSFFLASRNDRPAKKRSEGGDTKMQDAGIKVS